MPLFTASFVSLILFVPLLMTSGLVTQHTGCDVSTVKLPTLPSALPQPTTNLSFVTIGVGVQNYTCNDAGIYASAGAVAEIFDTSCLYKAQPIYKALPGLVMTAWKVAGPKVTAQSIVSKLQVSSCPFTLGQHYFIPNPITGAGISPKWDFTSQQAFKGSSNAFVVAAKAAGAAAPTGAQDVDWLYLKNVQGGLATEVYRVDTRQGQPPASCTPNVSPPISVKYVANYYLFGGSVEK